MPSALEMTTMRALSCPSLAVRIRARLNGWPSPLRTLFGHLATSSAMRVAAVLLASWFGL